MKNPSNASHGGIMGVWAYKGHCKTMLRGLRKYSYCNIIDRTLYITPQTCTDAGHFQTTSLMHRFVQRIPRAWKRSTLRNSTMNSAVRSVRQHRDAEKFQSNFVTVTHPFTNCHNIFPSPGPLCQKTIPRRTSLDSTVRITSSAEHRN